MTILLRSSDPGEGIPSPESLVFTASNFGTTQTVNVKPVDDNLLDGSRNYEIELLSISGTGTGYDGYDASDVTVTNSDNEEGPAGIYSMATDNETSEDGDTGIIKVRLDSEPMAMVIIPVDDNDSSEASVSPSTLVFTQTNWNKEQTVTVTGLDDFVDDETQNYYVDLVDIISSDSSYDNIPGSTFDNNTRLSFTNSDNDTKGIIITATDLSLIHI